MLPNIILFSFGMPEIILIGLVILLLFGGKKIPELMKGIGKGLTEFKKGMKEEDKNTENDDKKPTDLKF
jgi:sec-independent protein translocase protein TatA